MPHRGADGPAAVRIFVSWINTVGRARRGVEAPRRHPGYEGYLSRDGRDLPLDGRDLSRSGPGCRGTVGGSGLGDRLEPLPARDGGTEAHQCGNGDETCLIGDQQRREQPVMHHREGQARLRNRPAERPAESDVTETGQHAG